MYIIQIVLNNVVSLNCFVIPKNLFIHSKDFVKLFIIYFSNMDNNYYRMWLTEK